MLTFIKRPSEQYTIAFDFTDALAPGRTIASGAASATIKATGADATSTVIGTPSATVTGTIVSFQIKGGADATTYQLTLKATLDNGDLLQEDVAMTVSISS